VAFVTVWPARRAKAGDTRRVLCGRMVDGRHSCDLVIAWTLDGTLFVLPGLTEAGTPGRWRWSSDSLRRLDRHNLLDRRRRPDDPTKHRSLLTASVPCTIPCAAKHENSVDVGLL
jgi:hypothetical protein